MFKDIFFKFFTENRLFEDQFNVLKQHFGERFQRSSGRPRDNIYVSLRLCLFCCVMSDYFVGKCDDDVVGLRRSQIFGNWADMLLTYIC